MESKGKEYVVVNLLAQSLRLDLYSIATVAMDGNSTLLIFPSFLELTLPSCGAGCTGLPPGNA